MTRVVPMYHEVRIVFAELVNYRPSERRPGAARPEIPDRTGTRNARHADDGAEEQFPGPHSFLRDRAVFNSLSARLLAPRRSRVRARFIYLERLDNALDEFPILLFSPRSPSINGLSAEDLCRQDV